MVSVNLSPISETLGVRPGGKVWNFRGYTCKQGQSSIMTYLNSVAFDQRRSWKLSLENFGLVPR